MRVPRRAVHHGVAPRDARERMARGVAFAEETSAQRRVHVAALREVRVASCGPEVRLRLHDAAGQALAVPLVDEEAPEQVPRDEVRVPREERASQAHGLPHPSGNP